MLEKVRKAIERRINLADVISWLAIVWQRGWSCLWGTVALRVKGVLFGIPIGQGATACGPVILGRWPGSHISIGPGCSLISSSRRCTAATLYAPVRLKTFYPAARICLERGVQLNGTAITARSTTIAIGRNTMIAPNCVITDSDFHAPWPAERRYIDPGLERDAGVTIGAHVWIGMYSIILKGVHIGDGAIIAAGSVVVNDIPSGCLAAGVPAKIVRRQAGEAQPG